MTKRNTITSFGHNLSAAAPSELPELAIFCESGNTDAPPTPTEEAVSALISEGAEVRWVGKDEMVVRLLNSPAGPVIAILHGNKMAMFPLSHQELFVLMMTGPAVAERYMDVMCYNAYLDEMDAIIARERGPLKKGDSEEFDDLLEKVEYARDLKFTSMDDDELAEVFWDAQPLGIVTSKPELDALVRNIRADVARLKEAGSIAADAISQAKH